MRWNVCRPKTPHLNTTNTHSSTNNQGSSPEFLQRPFSSESSIPSGYAHGSSQPQQANTQHCVDHPGPVIYLSPSGLIQIPEWVFGTAPPGDSTSSADVIVTHKVSEGERHAHARIQTHKRATGRQQLGSDCLIDDVKVLLGRSRNSISSNRIRTCAKKEARALLPDTSGGGGRGWQTG